MFDKRPFRPAILMFCMALVMTACSSCATGATAIRAHSHAAETLDELATDARGLALEMRLAALNDAKAKATADGRDPAGVDKAIDDAATEFDDGPIVPAVNAFVAAKDAYVRAVLASAAKESPSWADVKPFLRDVVKAYEGLRAAIGRPDKMPAIPDAIANLLSSVHRRNPAEAVS